MVDELTLDDGLTLDPSPVATVPPIQSPTAQGGLDDGLQLDDSPVTPRQSIDYYIDRASKKYGVAPDLIHGVIGQESSYNPKARPIDPKTGRPRSSAKGLMQLTDSTSAELGVTDPYDIEQNIDGGTRYLRQQLDRFNGNVELALEAYHDGPTAVSRRLRGEGKARDKESLEYTSKVLNKAGRSSELTLDETPSVGPGDPLELRTNLPPDESVDPELVMDVAQNLTEHERWKLGRMKREGKDPLEIDGFINPTKLSPENKQELDKLDGLILELENSNAPQKDEMLKAIHKRRLVLMDGELNIPDSRSGHDKWKEAYRQEQPQPKLTADRLMGGLIGGVKQGIEGYLAGARSDVEKQEGMMLAASDSPEGLVEAEKHLMKHPITGTMIRQRKREIMAETSGISEDDAHWEAARQISEEMATTYGKQASTISMIEESRWVAQNPEYAGSSGFIEDVAKGVGTSITLLPAYAINPVVGGATTYVNLKGQAYSNLEDTLADYFPHLPKEERRKLANTASTWSAGVQLPMEFLGNLVQIKGILGPTGFGQYMGAIFNATIGEGVTEYFQQYPDEIAVIWALNRDLSRTELIDYIKEKLPEINKRAIYAGKVGAVSGGVTVGAGKMSVDSIRHFISDKQQRINMERANAENEKARYAEARELDDFSESVKLAGDQFKRPAPGISEATAKLATAKTKEQKAEAKAELKEAGVGAKNWFVTRFVDRIAPLKKISKDTYKHAAVYPGAMDRVAFMLDDLVDGMTSKGETDGPSIEGRMEFWDRYLFVERALSRLDRGIKSGKNPKTGKALTRQELQTMSHDLRKYWKKNTGQSVNDLITLRERWNEFFFKGIVEEGTLAGVIPLEVRNDLKARRDAGETYATFEVLDKIDQIVERSDIPETARSDIKAYTYKKQRGTEEKIDFSSEATIRKFIRSQVFFERNKVIRTLVEDPAKSPGMTFRPVVMKGKGAKARYDALKEAGKNPVMEDGYSKQELSEVEFVKDQVIHRYVVDKPIGIALKQMVTPNNMPNWINMANNIFRQSATTANPAFIVPNAVRDYTLTWGSSPAHKWYQPIGILSPKGYKAAGKAFMAREGNILQKFHAALRGTTITEKVEGMPRYGIPDTEVTTHQRGLLGGSSGFFFNWLDGIFDGAQGVLGYGNQYTWKRHALTGGGFGWTASEIRTPKDSLKRILKMRGRHGKLGIKAITNAIVNPKQWLAVIGNMNETIEYGPRLAVRKAVVRELRDQLAHKMWRKYTGEDAPIQVLGASPDAMMETLSIGLTIGPKMQPGYTFTAQDELAQNQVHRQLVEEFDRELSFIVRQSSLDFNRAGTWTKLANNFVPFLNARVQGAATYARSLATTPEFYKGKEKTEATREKLKTSPFIPRMGQRAKLMAADPRANAAMKHLMSWGTPTISAFLMNSLITDQSGEIWDDIPNYIKDNNWVIINGWVEKDGKMTPSMYLIPKGEVGKTGNALEKWLYAALKDERQGPELVPALLSLMSDVVSPFEFMNADDEFSPGKVLTSLPPWMRAVIEPTANYDFYRERELETQGMQHLAVYERATKQTPQSYKDFSKWLYDEFDLSIAPVRIQKIMENIATVYGREGFDPGRVGAGVLKRFYRQQGGATAEQGHKMLNTLETDYTQVITEVKKAVADGDRTKANILINKWNMQVNSRVDELPTQQLENLGYETRNNRGIKKEMRIDGRQRKNLLRGRTDDRSSIEKRLGGRKR